MDSLDFTKTIITYLYIVIVLIGLFTNALTFVVFSRKKFQNTVFSMYFRFLVISDTASLFLPINKFFELGMNMYFRNISDLLCKVRYYLVYVINPISGWTLVVISFDRMISICWPNKYRIVKKFKFKMLAICIILGLNLTYYIPNWLFYLKITKKFNNATNTTTISSQKCTNPGFPLVWLDMLETTLIPFLFMIIFTSLTLNSLKKTKKFKKSTKSSSQNKNQIKLKRFAIISMSLNILFLVLNLPYGLLSVIYSFVGNLIDDSLYGLLQSICYLLVYSNFSTIFFINILFNSMFRKEFMIMFMARLVDLKQNGFKTTFYDTKDHHI